MRWLALILLLANAGLVAWQAAGTPGRSQGDEGLPEEVGQLSLLREPDGATGGDDDTECYTLGPLSSEETAAAAGERMEDLGVEPSLRVIEDEETTGYQVILPPFEDREAAEAATEELEAAGIQDYFVFSEDDMENAVSLGVFSRQEYAADHQDYLADLGFDAELRLRTRSRERYWQDFRDRGGLIQPEPIEAWVGDGPLQLLPRSC